MRRNFFLPPTEDLTTHPNVTFMKKVYQRHESFEIVNALVESAVTSASPSTSIVTINQERIDLDVLSHIGMHCDDPSIDFVDCVGKIELWIGDTVFDKIEMLKNDPLGNEIKRRDVGGTTIIPWFWFATGNGNGDGAFPICATDEDVKLIVHWKKTSHLDCVQFFYRGFILNPNERHRYLNTQNEYLVRVRQPVIHMITSVPYGYVTKKWTPRQHHLFGKSFSDSVFTLLCCLRRTFGVIDRNIRNRFVGDLARAQGGMLVNRFSVKLGGSGGAGGDGGGAGWNNPTSAMYFTLYDVKNCEISTGGIIFVSLDDETDTSGAISICPGVCLDQPGNVWKFALNPMEHQPSGHIHHLDRLTLHVDCDSRVRSISVQSIAHKLVSITGQKTFIRSLQSME